MMKRSCSRFLANGFAALALSGMFLAASGSVQAADVIKLKFGHADNERAVFHIGAVAFKKEVEKRSNGGIEVTIYPNAQLGSVREVFEGLQMGHRGPDGVGERHHRQLRSGRCRVRPSLPVRRLRPCVPDPGWLPRKETQRRDLEERRRPARLVADRFPATSPVTRTSRPLMTSRACGSGS